MKKQLFLHTLWRILTLLLVVILAVGTSVFVIPFLDQRLSLFPVILISYILVAYLLIPLIFRFWRLVMKPNHIPRYATTPDGWPADPVNIAVIARSERHLTRTMRRAGWYKADKSGLRNDLHAAYAYILNKPYPTAPFSTLYLFGRKFDVGYEIPYGKNNSPRRRHHVRFWQLIDQEGSHDDTHYAYWLERIRHLFRRHHTIWIGAAIEDTRPIGIRWRNLQFTHGNAAEHTEERDYIIRTMEEAGLVKSVQLIRDGEPFRMRSQNIGTSFVVDGNIKVVTLKRLIRRK